MSQGQLVTLRNGPPVLGIEPEIQRVTASVLCPFCAEPIARGAKKCKHCGELLDANLRAAQEATRAPVAPAMIVAPQQTVIVHMPRKRWSRGMALLLSLFLPGLGHLYKGQPFSALFWLVITPLGYLAFVVPGVVLHLLCLLSASLGDNNNPKAAH
jgi:hypothetical protein